MMVGYLVLLPVCTLYFGLGSTCRLSASVTMINHVVGMFAVLVIVMFAAGTAPWEVDGLEKKRARYSIFARSGCAERSLHDLNPVAHSRN